VATHTITTTQRPDELITVDDAEYERLLQLGLVYSGNPVAPAADFYDGVVADRVGESGSLTQQAVDARVAAAGGSVSDATTSGKGVVQLAGDLAGTAAAPTVTGGSHHGHTASQISDATTVGRSVLTAADAATARTAIGAGTSSLALGTTSTTAKAGNYQPAASNISDSTTVGRSVLTAADAPTARAAIGAGTVTGTGITAVVSMTAAAYAALATKDASTLYVVTP